MYWVKDKQVKKEKKNGVKQFKILKKKVYAEGFAVGI
jgi:hypothetical protein